MKVANNAAISRMTGIDTILFSVDGDRQWQLLPNPDSLLCFFRACLKLDLTVELTNTTIFGCLIWGI